MTTTDVDTPLRIGTKLKQAYAGGASKCDANKMSARYLSSGCVEVLCSLVLMAALSAAGVAQADDPVSKLQHYKCYVCHANDETRTGPAYVDVAARYRGNPKAVAILEAAIKRGAHGSGPWHMPPHPEVSNVHPRAAFPGGQRTTKGRTMSRLSRRLATEESVRHASTRRRIPVRKISAPRAIPDKTTPAGITAAESTGQDASFAPDSYASTALADVVDRAVMRIEHGSEAMRERGLELRELL